MRLLLVEDDDVYRAALGRALTRAGYAVTACAGVEAAIDALGAAAPDYALVDLRLADGSGVDVVRAVRAARPDARVLVLTGHGSVAAAVDAMRAGAVDMLEKPLSTDRIVEALRAAPAPTPPLAAMPTLAETERAAIARALDRTGGNITHAAALLGVDRRTLQRKLR